MNVTLSHADRFGWLVTAAMWAAPQMAQADINERLAATFAAADWLTEALVDPVESGGETWGVFDGFELGPTGNVGGWELPGFYATAGHALLSAHRIGGTPNYLDEAIAVADYLLANQGRSLDYLIENGMTPGGLMVVEGGNPTFYATHQARAAWFLVELYADTGDEAFLDAAVEILAFAASELRSIEVGTANFDGFVYTADISRLGWPNMFVVGFSEADMGLALSRIEPYRARHEDWDDLVRATNHLAEIQQDANGGIYFTNRDVDRVPEGADVRGAIASIALREVGNHEAGRLAVEWLKEHQELDGSFTPPLYGRNTLVREHTYAMRALVDAGEDPFGPEGSAFQAVEWLLDAQLADGSFPLDAGGMVADADVTGVATLGLARSLWHYSTIRARKNQTSVGRGATLQFRLSLINHGPITRDMDYWIEVRTPTGDIETPVPPATATIPAQDRLTSYIQARIPMDAPIGDYVLRFFCGQSDPLIVDDLDGIPFRVEAAPDTVDSPHVAGLLH